MHNWSNRIIQGIVSILATSALAVTSHCNTFCNKPCKRIRYGKASLGGKQLAIIFWIFCLLSLYAYSATISVANFGLLLMFPVMTITGAHITKAVLPSDDVSQIPLFILAL